MPVTETLRAFPFARPGHGRSDVEGEQDGTVEEAQEQQGQPTEPQEQEAKQVEPAPDYQDLLDRQDARIAELEAQVAEAAKSKEAADALAAEIERVRAEAAEEKVAYELRLAGARNVTAAKALLGEHGGDVAKLKAAEPWLFEGAAPTGGTTGLEPAGAAGGDDAESKRWRSIAGLEDGN